MSKPTVERRYVLTRIARGDYLLPANDGGALWRICVYMDGPTYGLEDWPRDRELWTVCKWLGALDQVDTTNWDMWERRGDGFTTRAAAIEAALTHEGYAR